MSTITLRPTRPDDTALLFAWRSHPDIYKWSRAQEPPKWTGLLQWGPRVLTDDRFLSYIAELDGHPVGVLILDRGEHPTEVSLAVAPGLHGRGIGRAMLAAVGAQRRGIICAEVLPGNIASHRMFTAAGWRKSLEGWYVRRAA